MSNIERFQVPGMLSRTSQAGRSIARIEANGSVRLVQLEMTAEIQAATADAVTYVGRRALQDVALLSSIEQQLALSVPAASGRLAAIADMTALALSEVVADTASKLRRL